MNSISLNTYPNAKLQKIDLVIYLSIIFSSFIVLFSVLLGCLLIPFILCFLIERIYTKYKILIISRGKKC
jgi:uncharacterized membrane protein